MFCRTRAMGWDDGVEGAGGCRCFFLFFFGSSTVRAPPYATVFTLSIPLAGGSIAEEKPGASIDLGKGGLPYVCEC